MICPYCGKEAEWVPNEVVYGIRKGKSYMCYWCEPCDAYVGCANNTTKPLGTMANKELRTWRIRAHAAIDPIWKSKQMTREEVYQMLKQWFGVRIHIGEANVETCRAIVSAIKKGRI